MIASVQKATKILTVVASGGFEPMPLQDISACTEINKSTCSHIIDTLMREGFLVKVSPSKGYILGPAAYYLSNSGRYGNDLIAVCRPIMSYLYKTLGYCLVLSVIEGADKYIIDYIDDGTIFKQKQKIRKDDIYRTATGRAILKNMSDSEIYTIWSKYGKPSADDWAEINDYHDLLQYRDTACSHDIIVTRMQNESNVVNIGYGVPIFHNHKCVGAIGVAVKIQPNEEKFFNTNTDPKIKKLLIKGAAVISSKL